MSLDIPYIPFGTKGWGGQVGQRVVFKGHHGTSLILFFLLFLSQTSWCVCQT